MFKGKLTHTPSFIARRVAYTGYSQSTLPNEICAPQRSHAARIDGGSPAARRVNCAASQEASRLDFRPGEYDHSIIGRANAHIHRFERLARHRDQPSAKNGRTANQKEETT
ncbi:hypothetical protein CBA19CS22_04030 [Caballeronia novacaledonica]|uniref:Uncharacterized protein n=1 Tax=Caballeronia novacaledonica TaxID=1544861 RepID=A0ACB5QL87_9BURK|nr:hypothetical protein CBA19CS22_04030 [Caballeronia novacaledonica]